ncbi:MAG: hypothetical protein HXX08_16950 [Chloroflexi bacterium]|uniref:ABC transporter substrate-binding protein n=1 Tax=Candidatus Chlorohelix allophototropha TaxID=3003348 RepID=A0A8T7M655_9CHLR|nr:hypothetical protein [Chloroflexota bacterium]WJW69460.1 ABC transporter substrate-binding protein [Chloroflexota bacterium L227-S17]
MVNRLRLQVFVAGVGFLAIALSLAYFLLAVPRFSTPAQGGTYVEGLVVEGIPEVAINPLLQINDLSRDISSLVFTGLTRNEADGTVKDDIAEAHYDLEGGKVWEFYLRHDVYWQDGFPVTSKDVIFTVNVLKSDDFATFSPSARALHDIWKDIEVDRLGDYAVRFRLTRSVWTPFLNYTSVGLLPEHQLRSVPVTELRRADFNLTPIGTGPYRLQKDGISPDSVSLQVNPLYYGQKPYLEKIWFRFYPSARAALTALESNQVDGISSVSPEDQAKILNRTDIRELTAPYAANTFLFFNLNRTDLFGQKEVRQAITQSIDRNTLVKEEFAGQAVVSNSPILSFLWAYKADIKTFDFNPSAARNLLDQAGWKLNQENIRVKDGQTLTFTLLIGSADEQVIAERLVSNLRDVGIVAAVRLSASPREFINDLDKRRYDAVMLATKGVTNDPDVFQIWSSSGVFNYSNWKNDKADRLLEEARQILAQDERKKRYDQWQDLWIEDLPAVPLYYQLYTYAVSDRVQGLDSTKLKVVNETSDRLKDIANRYVLSNTRFGN